MTIPAFARTAVDCLALRPDERFLMICDDPLVEAGLAVADAAIARGASALVTVLPLAARPLSEPSRGILSAIPETDAVLLWLQRMWTEEVQWRRSIYDLCAETGARIAFGGAMDQGILANEMSADYTSIRERTRAFAAALEPAQSIRVTGRSGTDLTVAVVGRDWKLDDGLVDQPGQFANLPAGEVFIAPLETEANGVLVVDCSLSLGDPDLTMVDEPVHIHFEAGRVVAVEGGRSAAAFRELITQPGANVIAELGIGTNEKARMQGNVMTDEKVLGSIHVAVGYNLGSYGGINDSPVHCDCCVADADVYADGKLLIEKGRLVN